MFGTCDSRFQIAVFPSSRQEVRQVRLIFAAAALDATPFARRIERLKAGRRPANNDGALMWGLFEACVSVSVCVCVSKCVF